MYADDLTITISDTKPEIIQSKFNTVDAIIKEWCHDNKMIISNKTKTMLFTNKYSEDVTNINGTLTNINSLQKMKQHHY